MNALQFISDSIVQLARIKVKIEENSSFGDTHLKALQAIESDIDDVLTAIEDLEQEVKDARENPLPED